MSEHDELVGVLASILEEQQKTRDSIIVLAEAIHAAAQIKRAEAEQVAEKAVAKAKKSSKAQPEVAENAGSNGSEQVPVKTPATPVLPTVPAVSEAVAPITKQELQVLAANLAKKNRDAVVSALAAASKTGNIKEADEDELPAIKAALEALV